MDEQRTKKFPFSQFEVAISIVHVFFNHVQDRYVYV